MPTTFRTRQNLNTLISHDVCHTFASALSRHLAKHRENVPDPQGVTPRRDTFWPQCDKLIWLYRPNVGTRTSVANADELNEYQAAALTGLSPTLLRWLTSHAPKTGSQRKLPVARKSDDLLFFNKNDLIKFNEWLKLPWPRKGTARPLIPIGIRKEIKFEANGACAICNSHVDTCEAAHIDPVSKSNNNHPENLIWLCSNHHRVYDKGLFGPNDENAEFIIDLKRVLHRFKRMIWIMQDELSAKLFSALDTCALLSDKLNNATTTAQVDAVRRLAIEALEHVPSIAPVSQADPKYELYKKINIEAAFIADNKNDVKTRLQRAKSVRDEVVSAFGLVPCPLCQGAGRHSGLDCPVCSGDGQVSTGVKNLFNPADFIKVDCPVCRGEGRFRGEDCPACGGDARIEQRRADRIDKREYELVDCPVCRGKGRFRGEDCPACGGDARMEQRRASRITPDDFLN